MKKKGFTLIEMLVAITILSILAGFLTFSLQDSQKRGRDSRRKSDLDVIKKALETAKTNSPGSYGYPRCNVVGVFCQISDDGAGDNSETGTPRLSPTYIKEIPTDPKTKEGYFYFPTNAGFLCLPNICTNFELTACLENNKDPQKDQTPSPFCSPSYTVKND